ncbi:fumarate hydratase [Salinisphaera aquimarina]|uniref:Fumarate hydratase class I n=1 Tax=Salinisphaera aquimarina TaxID=2094031 RepID=A0ABV7ELN3_9GAMM
MIKQDDFIQSVADALQYIAIYHPPDFIRALSAAHARERSPAARDAMAQILINSRLCAEGHRPVCQDTGIVVAFVDIGMDVQWQTTLTLEDMVNEGVRRAWGNADNPLRASIVGDPAGARRNTGDNTPAVVHVRMVAGDRVTVELSSKGGGSEAKARFAMLNPSDDIADWVLEQIPLMGAGWCPPGIIGVGIGGTAEKAMVMAKQACTESIDIQELQARGADTATERLRLDLFERINQLGIGAQGLGGLTTVLDIKIRDYPCHAANKPVALVPNCAATRHVTFTLDGSGPAVFDPPSLNDWPEITNTAETGRRVNLDDLTRDDIAAFEPGESLLLSGHMLTGRDAAHKRIQDLLEAGEPLPEGVDFNNRFIYYVGPVDAVGDEVVGPAGPTTATRMDKFTDMMLARTGLLGMIGKAERGPEAIDAIRRHGAVYLIAIGGAAFLVSKAIRSARVVAFADLGMEAIHEFEIVDMPVTVAVDSRGESVHRSGPAYWRNEIAGIPVAQA